MAMSGDEQFAYSLTFPPGEFSAWLKAAHEQWLAQQDREPIGPDGSVDLD